MSYWNRNIIINAGNCLTRASDIIYDASQYPYHITRQCPVLIEAAEKELEVALKLIKMAKKEND